MNCSETCEERWNGGEKRAGLLLSLASARVGPWLVWPGDAMALTCRADAARQHRAALDLEFYDKLFPSLGVFGATHTVRLLSLQKNSNISFCSSLSVPQTGEEQLISVERWTPCWSFAGNWTSELAGLRPCCSSICNLLPATVSPWPSWGSQPQLRSSSSAVSN